MKYNIQLTYFAKQEKQGYASENQSPRTFKNYKLLHPKQITLTLN